MIKNTIHEIFNKKVDALGFSIFRMLYTLIVFCEVLHLYRFRNIIYDRVPFLVRAEVNVDFIFGFWFVTLILLFVGLFTRFATILNYLFGIIIFSSALQFEYHVFYTYVGVNFLLIFLPVSRVFSLDSLIQKVKYTHIGKPYQIDRKILEINYLLPVYIGIALIYFDSIFLKLQNRLWTSGLGVWLPSSLPIATWNDLSFVLNQKELMLFLGYFVLVFETVFIFLFWFRKLRVSLLVIGIFFHVGIMLTYPIPYFALTFVVIYLLLIPVSFWTGIASKLKSKKTIYTFYYDAECPLCNKVVVVIKHLDVFHTVSCLTVQGNYQNDAALQPFSEETLLINIHGVTASGKVSVGYWSYVQLFKSLVYTYPLGIVLSVPGISHIGRKIYSYIAGDRLTIRCTAENCSIPVLNTPTEETQDVLIKGWNQLAITKKTWKVVVVGLFIIQCLFIAGLMRNPIGAGLKRAFGVSRHGVFLDHHFKGYNHAFKVMYVGKDGKRTIVPIMDENGMPDDYVSGVTWRNITFNVVTSIIREHKFEKGIVPYLRFYLNDNHLSVHNANFEIYYKTMETPVNWELNFLHKQMVKPWIKAGTCQINEKTEAFQWNAAMKELISNEPK